MIAVCIALAAVFGAADQYLGSLSAHPWGADVSGLSAPWLVLPFVVGVLQRTPRRAAAAGVAATLAALAGYCLMTLSPVENAHLSIHGVVAFVRGGNDRWIVAGIVSGPLFGWLGYTWRSTRALWPGVVTGLLITLEPLARRVYGTQIRSPRVWVTEMVVGGVAAAVTVVVAQRRRIVQMT